MIDFRSRESRGSSILIVLSLVSLAVTLAFMLFFLLHPPSAAGVVKGRTKTSRSIQSDIDKLKRRSAQIQQEVRPLLWTRPADEVTAALLNSVTREANRRNLKLTAFRPQKPQEFAGVTELPFVLSISGPYSVVAGMIRLLDDPSERMAMRSVQIAASESDSSVVTATLAISAYLASAPAGAKDRSNEG
jgi:Tfp pilus assembly protein PilO